jgi:hypothetical protein
MKKIIFSLIFTFSAFIVCAQKDYYVKEGPLKFTIPNDKWMPLPEKKNANNSCLLHFKRLGVKDSVGRKAFPEIVIIIEPVHANAELTDYSLNKQKPYKNLKKYRVEKVFTSSDGMLRLHYAVGQKNSYEDANGIKHTFYFIHAIKHHRGIQVIIDIPSDLFETYEEELVSVIKSLD